MRKPHNILAGLFALTFALVLGVSTVQAQAGPGVIQCPNGLYVYNGERCQDYDEESVPQNNPTTGSSSMQSGSTSRSVTTQNTAPAAPGAESAGSDASADQPAAAATPEPQVVTKTEDKSVLDYLPWPAILVAESLTKALTD